MRVPVKWIKEYVDIPEDLKVFTDKMSMIGHLLDKTEVTDTDTVIDLELRGNRADCFGILGIARESHASFGDEFGGRFDIPKTNALPEGKYKGFEVKVETPAVKRFYSCVITNLKVGPSPEWMQERLKNYGIEPINNLVDITNYVMIESGMPMHAFDLDQMGGNQLVLRPAKEGETVVTFDGGTLKLTQEDVIFSAEDGTPLGIAGVIGGKFSGINENTKNILLECAGYDRVSIRKSVFRHNAHTEAGLRHSHDLSESLCDYALARAADLYMQFASNSDTNIEGIDDYYPSPETPRVIVFDPNETTRLGGVEIPFEKQEKVLQRLEFGIEETVDELDQSKNLMVVTVPLFRTDVFESADLVEEVLRIWGYENIPSKTLASVIPDPVIQPEVVIEEKSKDLLTALGLNEVMTVPMTTVVELEKTKDPLIKQAIVLVNPPTSEHTHMRTNMFTTLIEAVQKVMDRGDESAQFFEAGKIYLKKASPVHQPPHKEDFPYMELRQIAAIVTSKNKAWDFYKMKGVVEEYLDQLGVKDAKFVKSNKAPFGISADIKSENILIGTVGILDTEVTNQNFGIKTDCYGFLIDLEKLLKAPKVQKSYAAYSDFPPVKQDMSVEVNIDVEGGVIKDEIETVGKGMIRDVVIGDVYEIDNKKSLLFKINYQSKEKTLSSDEVNKLHMQIEERLVHKFGAKIRGREQANVPQKTSGQIIVGQILSIEKHPDADRLVVCQVKVGPDETVQIVTGAPNMKVGDKVPVALPGTVVPGVKDEEGNPIVMKVAKLRGIPSHGMMLARDELGIGEDHEGLLILPEDSIVGDVFKY